MGKKERGFTLIEVVVSVVVMFLLAEITFNLADKVLTMTDRSKSKLSSSREVSLVLNLLEDDLESRVVFPNPYDLFVLDSDFVFFFTHPCGKKSVCGVCYILKEWKNGITELYRDVIEGAEIMHLIDREVFQSVSKSTIKASRYTPIFLGQFKTMMIGEFRLKDENLILRNVQKFEIRKTHSHTDIEITVSKCNTKEPSKNNQNNLLDTKRRVYTKSERPI